MKGIRRSQNAIPLVDKTQYENGIEDDRTKYPIKDNLGRTKKKEIFRKN